MKKRDIIHLGIRAHRESHLQNWSVQCHYVHACTAWKSWAFVRYMHDKPGLTSVWVNVPWMFSETPSRLREQVWHLGTGKNNNQNLEWIFSWCKKPHWESAPFYFDCVAKRVFNLRGRAQDVKKQPWTKRTDGCEDRDVRWRLFLQRGRRHAAFGLFGPSNGVIKLYHLLHNDTHGLSPEYNRCWCLRIQLSTSKRDKKAQWLTATLRFPSPDELKKKLINNSSNLSKKIRITLDFQSDSRQKLLFFFCNVWFGPDEVLVTHCEWSNLFTPYHTAWYHTYI